MVQWFRALLERAKALLLSAAAVDLEVQILEHYAQRKAELLRRVKDLEAEHLPTLADQLRRRAEALDSQQPLALVVLAVPSGPSTEQVAALEQAEGTNVVPTRTSPPSKPSRRPTPKGR